MRPTRPGPARLLTVLALVGAVLAGTPGVTAAAVAPSVAAVAPEAGPAVGTIEAVGVAAAVTVDTAKKKKPKKAAKKRATKKKAAKKKAAKKTTRRSAKKATKPARRSTATPAMRGQDFSWPQCPAGMGRGKGLPIPGTITPGLQFAVIGVNHGSPFNANPCLASQVEYARANHLWTTAYTLPAPPTDAELAQFAAAGPYPAHTRAGQMSNNGYVQAVWTANQIRSVGFHPNFMWLDVEPLVLRHWNTTAAGQADARAVIIGMQRGFADAGISTGIYTYATGWKAITGGMRSTAPFWYTTGRTNWSTATAACSRASATGGPVVLSQWYTRTAPAADYDVVCPKLATTGGMSRYFVKY